MIDGIELDVLPTGELRFCRCSPDINQELLDFLNGLLEDPSKTKQLEEFFSGSISMEKLIGDEPLCG